MSYRKENQQEAGEEKIQFRLEFDSDIDAGPAKEYLPDAPLDSWVERVRTESVRYTRMAAEIWPDISFPVLDLRFTLLGRTAGQASPSAGNVNYNLELLGRYGHRFVDEIVPHEVAHIVAAFVHRGRIRPHGKEWQAVMRAFGANPRTTHSFETTPARRVRRYYYFCLCDQIHGLVGRSHRRFQQGSMEYRCSGCKEVLEFTGESGFGA